VVVVTAPDDIPPLVAPGRPLRADERERFSRHLLLPGIGELGQRRLRNARVCVIGAGGLGAPVLLYLAAAGVGRLGVVDDDDVTLSNLQRQVIHGLDDVGRPKVVSAADAVARLDPGVDVVVHRTRLTSDTVGLLGDYDLVVDGTDNFPTRYLVNDACVRMGLPEVWGSVFRFDAQVSVFWGRPPAGVGPVQLRDLFPGPPPEGSVLSCAEGGVLGAMCGQVGSVMATEAVKLITGVGRSLLGRVLVLDALAASWAEVPLRGRDGDGMVDDGARTREVPAPDGAGGRHEDTAPRGAAPQGAAQQGKAGPPRVRTVSARDLAGWLAERRDLVLVDVREPAERAIVDIPGAVGIPLQELLDNPRARLTTDRPVVLYCRSGVRSERAGLALLASGHPDVAHLAGGVLAWVDEVDPSLPRY
jgi:adenylyltransferase/sulfurtransferase